MKIERTAVNGIPVRANWFVTPSPQSSTYARSLLSMMCDVMYRDRFGTVGFGPAPDPRITSLVPVPRFSAARTSLSCASSGGVWVAGAILAVSARGAPTRLANRPRRETPDRFPLSATARLLNRDVVAGRERVVRSLPLSLPDDPSEVRSPGNHDARRRDRLDKQFIAIDAEVASLLGAVPLLVPGRIDTCDEVPAFDQVLAGVCEHGPVERGPLRIRGSGFAVLRGGQCHRPPLARQDQVAPWVRSKHLLGRLVLDNHLPRQEFPHAHELLSRDAVERRGFLRCLSRGSD